MIQDSQAIEPPVGDEEKTSTRSWSRPASRSAVDLGYKNVAKIVGAELSKKKGSRKEAFQLPVVGGNRQVKLACQLELLKAEQRIELEQMKKLESSLSNTRVEEQKARVKADRQQAQHDEASVRIDDFEKKMDRLRKKMNSAGAPRQKAEKEHIKEPPKHNEGPAPSQKCDDRKPLKQDMRTDSIGSFGLSEDFLVAVPDDKQDNTCVAAWMQDNPEAAGLPAQPSNLVPFSQEAFVINVQRASTTGSKRSTMRRCTSLGSLFDVGPPPVAISPEEEAEVRRQGRYRIREQLKELNGSAKDAFKKLDLNGSGNISCQEFADGIGRMGINWQKITGVARSRDLFNMFDEDKDFKIVFSELFPDDIPDENARPSTPEFWRLYHRNRHHCFKTACWQPASCEAELETLQAMSQRAEDAANKRKWMCSTMRRLKTRGKSDGRCREVVALHLPRGSGPKDKEGVNTFSGVDLKMCRKEYNDEVNLPMRRMWKVVGDYKDQRREQKRICEKLYSVTEALAQKQKNEENLANLVGGLGLLGKFRDDAEPGKPGAAALSKHPPCFEEGDIEDLRLDFLKYADAKDMLGKQGFSKLMQVLMPPGERNDRQVDKLWEQVLKQHVGGDDETGERPTENISKAKAAQPTHRRVKHCSFEQFCWWWAEEQERLS